MPMPFEKLRLENPTEKKIVKASYQIRRDPQGLEAPLQPTIDVVKPSNPLPEGGVRDSVPRDPATKSLYPEVRNVHIALIEFGTGAKLEEWVLTTGGWESTIREVVVNVLPVNAAGTKFQATALLWFDDDSFFEFYSAPF